MRIPLLVLTPIASAAAAVAPVAETGDDGVLFGLPRAVVTVLGVGVAVMLLAILFLVRRFAGTIMNVVFLMLGAALVIIALFGHQIGVYDAIDEIVNAQPIGP